MTNSEKERLVCRPSRVDEIHDGCNKKKQGVKMADIFGVEKLCRGVYEAARQRRDFESKRSISLNTKEISDR